MEELANLIGKFKALDIEALARQVIEENRPLLEDFNAEQLQEGLMASGRDIVPEYSPFTIEEKKAKGQPYDRVTLKDTGDFWESIKIKTTRNELAFEATDPKADQLQEKYGEGILGLSEVNKTEFIEAYLREEMQDKIRKHFGA